MKIRMLVVGIGALAVAACAPDAPDAHLTHQPDVTSVKSTATTTHQTTPINQKQAAPSETENSEAPQTSSTPTSVGELDKSSTNQVIAPYRGTPAQPTLLLQPRLALKVDNAPTALPQEGLQQADIVFEELVEGGLTRFLAIFHSEVPEFVGPIRSGRSSDIPLLMPFDGALFGWSGANRAFRGLLDTVAIQDVGVYENPAQYWRKSDRVSPSNLWARSTHLLQQAEIEQTSVEPLWPFEEPLEELLDPGQKVGGVQVNWGLAQVSFLWVENDRGWKRFQNGKEHLAVTSEGDESQITAENVVIQFTRYVLTEEVDGNGARIPLAQLSEGSGEAWIFKNGSITEGRWVKPNITVHTQFLDEAGAPISMAPGATWVLLAPRDSAIIIDADG